MGEQRRYAQADEPSLLEWARGGDERAFAALMARHRPMLESLCLRIVGDRHEAEDALQTALLAAWQHLGRFEGRSKLSTWLYRIAHNAALAVARQRRPEPRDEPFDEILSSAASPERVVEVDAVRGALARLPPDFRAALVLRDMADLPYAEIAEIQGIRVETVKTRISRARQGMHRLLADA
jgi:RNA polymerase sigma factor (sigma-70 family)